MSWHFALLQKLKVGVIGVLTPILFKVRKNK